MKIRSVGRQPFVSGFRARGGKGAGEGVSESGLSRSRGREEAAGQRWGRGRGAGRLRVWPAVPSGPSSSGPSPGGAPCPPAARPLPAGVWDVVLLRFQEPARGAGHRLSGESARFLCRAFFCFSSYTYCNSRHWFIYTPVFPCRMGSPSGTESLPHSPFLPRGSSVTSAP